jgi:hypothetical protein
MEHLAGLAIVEGIRTSAAGWSTSAMCQSNRLNDNLGNSKSVDSWEKIGGIIVNSVSNKDAMYYCCR